MTTSYNFKQVFAAACLAMLLFGIVLTSLGAILPNIIDKFGLGTMQAGSLASILPAGILAGSLVFGPIVDRYSYRGLLVCCAIFIVIGLQGIAFSSQVYLLQACFFLIGFGGGALNGAASALVADISEAQPDQRSANLSLLGIFYGIGALGVPSLMALLSSVLSYEQILSYTGLSVLLPALYFGVLQFPAPKQSQAPPLKATWALLGDARLSMLGLFLFFQSAIEGVTSNWVTTFLQTKYAVTATDALLALSVFIMSLTVTRLFFSSLLRRMSPYRVLVISVFILLLAAALFLLPELGSLFFLSMALFGIGSAAGFPVILGYVGELYAERTGTAFSFVFGIALIGNILINYAMGLIAQRFGIEQYPLVILVCTVGLLLIALTKLPGIVQQQN